MMGLAMLFGAGVFCVSVRPSTSSDVSHPRRRMDISNQYATREDQIDRWWSEVEHSVPWEIGGLPNIMFVKSHKVGSSSMSNLIRLIAARNGGIPREYFYTVTTTDYFYAKKELHPLEEGIHIWTDHQTLSSLLESGESMMIKESFKLALVRDPVDRCLSSFYYYRISKDRGLKLKHLSDKDLTQMKLEFDYCGKSAKLSAQMYEVGPKGIASSVEETLGFYDLVAVTGRYTESLAVMQMILGLRYGDMLYFNDKYHPGKRPPVSEEPPEVIEHMKSLVAQADWDLFYSADLQLTETIEMLEPEFTVVHNRLTESLTNARLHCDEEHAHLSRGYRLPEAMGCFSGGNCMLSCLNKFATDHDLWDGPVRADLRA
ncbi:unnamed protein product [Discosporangium mesarthrocarpum]